MLRKFSITPEEYDQILVHQDGTCAICDSPPGKYRLAVDHNHKTGLVRGLLCWACNTAIAKFRDDQERILRAAEYVTNPPVTAALGREVYGMLGSTHKRKKKKRGGTNGK